MLICIKSYMVYLNCKFHICKNGYPVKFIIITFLLFGCEESLPVREEPAFIKGVVSAVDSPNRQMWSFVIPRTLSNIPISAGAENTYYKTLDAETEVEIILDLWFSEDPTFRRTQSYRNFNPGSLILDPGDTSFVYTFQWDHANDEGELAWDYFFSEPDCNSIPEVFSDRCFLTDSCSCIYLTLNINATIQIFKGRQATTVQSKVPVLYQLCDTNGNIISCYRPSGL